MLTARLLLTLLILAPAPIVVAQAQPKAKAAKKAAAENPPVVKPTLAEVRYGPHERHVLDFWRAGSATPTPLVFVIHGGGWQSGETGECALQPCS